MNFLLSKRMKYFIVTMEEKCITRAAEILCITRSPLGKVISDLEEHVGGKLFIRKYNTLEPTPLAAILYKRVKPLYETLISIENDLDKNKKNIKLNLTFDISIPYNVYKYYVNLIESENIELSHSRTYVNTDMMLKLQYSERDIVLSQRSFTVPEGIKRTLLSEDELCLLINESVNDIDLTCSEHMRKTPILVRTCNSLDHMTNWLSFVLKDNLPYLYFKECNSEMSTMLYSVSHGSAMVLLPKKVANFYQIKGVKSIPMKGITIKKAIYYNDNVKKSTPLQKVMEIFKDYF